MRLKIVGVFLFGVIALVSIYFINVVVMPGTSYNNGLVALTESDEAIKSALQQHVKQLAVTIGERNQFIKGSLEKSAKYIKDEFSKCSSKVTFEAYLSKNNEVKNVVAMSNKRNKGNSEQGVIVIGAHYDSAVDSPGANDNATGVAALLVLCNRLKNYSFKHNIHWVAFTNEEPPFFKSNSMGSYVYAKSLHKNKVNVVGMFSLETMGTYSSEPNSQEYPSPLEKIYPDKANFIAFIGNLASETVLKTSIDEFRNTTKFPSEGIIAPATIPGVDWSDHWSFWQFDYPAIMITDTALYRSPHYHTPTDTYDKVNFNELAQVVNGLQKVIIKLDQKL